MRETKENTGAYFGNFGGQFVAETLMGPLDELEKAFKEAIVDEKFINDTKRALRDFVGRPTPLTHVENLSKKLGGAQIYLKREDLCHSGAHKINNAICQAMLAKKMGKKRIVAETGAGQHGVATATACAALGLECVVYMGAKDAKRQAPNVQRIKLLGATFHEVPAGSQTLKDAVNEAIRDWITNIDNTHYLIGSVVGPHPFPKIVRYFQSVISEEAKQQLAEENLPQPSMVVACVGGGSNAIGAFDKFIEDGSVKLVGIQAGGDGLETEHHSAPLIKGDLGIFQGAKTFILQDEHGQIKETHSVAPGLDYPGVGPEHSFLKDTGRASYESVSDKEAIEAFQLLSREEGIIPALESSHAVAYALKVAPTMKQEEIILVNLSGRGDKDLTTVMNILSK